MQTNKSTCYWNTYQELVSVWTTAVITILQPLPLENIQ